MGWTWLEGDDFNLAFKGVKHLELEEEMELREPRIKSIATRIYEVLKAREEARFYEDARRDGGFESDDCDDDSDLRRAVHRAKEDAELRVLEAALAALGARMMRPYEHHNEDERLMEYMERDR
jgi:hypothetical protein